MVMELVNPLTDPIGFIFLYFMFIVSSEGIPALLKLGLFSSVVAFPFSVLGRYVYQWLHQRVHDIWKVPLLTFYLASLVTSIIFWVVIRTWTSFLNGTAFTTSSAVAIIGNILLISIIVYPFILLGYYLNIKIHQKWDMPWIIIFYILGLLMCIIFIAIIYIYMLAVGNFVPVW